MAGSVPLLFESWRRSALFDDAAEGGPRLAGNLKLTMSDSNGDSANGTIPFTFLAAGDIAAISPSAVKHLAPAPGTPNAEETKFAHIDFWEADLPWRYSPQRAQGGLVMPWMVLLAGNKNEITVAGQLANIISDNVLDPVDLNGLGRMLAHTQDDNGQKSSRLLSHRDLDPNTDYLAVVVPAFNQQGQLNWQMDAAGNLAKAFDQAGILPALYSWQFRTGEEGDFKTLALALTMRHGGDTGYATLHYHRSSIEHPLPVEADLQIRGAITSIQPAPISQKEKDVRTDLKAIDQSLEDVHAISMPQYGRPWLPTTELHQPGWPSDLNDDPRYRGIAGTGTWMGIQAQEALMSAAVIQAGALREAGQRIGNLALGLDAAGRLWSLRLPADKSQRLRTFGPMLDRMMTVDGEIATQVVTSGTSPFPAAFFSSAAQRLLRPRSASTRHMTGGQLDVAAAVEAINRPDPEPVRAPAGLPHFDPIQESLGQPPFEEQLGIDSALLAMIVAEVARLVDGFSNLFRRKRDALQAEGLENEVPALRAEVAKELMDQIWGMLQPALENAGIACNACGLMESIAGATADFHAYFMTVLEFDYARRRYLARLQTELRFCMASDRCPEWFSDPFEGEGLPCHDFVDFSPPRPPSKHEPIDPDGLVDIIVDAIDPRQPNPPGWVRLCSRLNGIDCSRLAPPEFPIGIDFPTWDLLRQYSKEWLLPGGAQLPMHTVLALQSNPKFIDAYMVGVNTQFMSEMRWRDLAVDRTCTPLRMFWGQVDYLSGKRLADIEPLLEWKSDVSQAIGAVAHQTIKPEPGNPDGSRLIVVFSTPLFRRYPSTLVYLVKPPEGISTTDLNKLFQEAPVFDKPTAEADIDTWRKNRKYLGPIYSGAITPDLVFFGFDVAPNQLEDYWLILDEPPSELRFWKGDAPDSASGAKYASTTIYHPTRVAMSGSVLLSEAKTL